MFQLADVSPLCWYGVGLATAGFRPGLPLRAGFTGIGRVVVERPLLVSRRVPSLVGGAADTTLVSPLVEHISRGARSFKLPADKVDSHSEDDHD